MKKTDVLAVYAEKLNALLDRLLGMNDSCKALNDIAYGYSRALVDAGVITSDDASNICLACLRQ